MENMIPPINLKGTFTLKQPLDTLINPKVIYRVSSIKWIQELIRDDIDVKQLIYLDQGLTEDDFYEDIKQEVPIVRLITDGGIEKNFPADHIVSMPQIIGKVFLNKALTVNLKYLPEELNIDFLQEEISDLIKTNIGIDTIVNIKTISSEYVATYEEYDQFEAKRLLNISNKTTCRYKLEEAYNTISKYKDKLKAVL